MAAFREPFPPKAYSLGLRQGSRHLTRLPRVARAVRNAIPYSMLSWRCVVWRRWALPPLPVWGTVAAAVLCAVNLCTGAALAAKHSRWAPWLLPGAGAMPLNEPSECSPPQPPFPPMCTAVIACEPIVRSDRTLISTHTPQPMLPLLPAAFLPRGSRSVLGSGCRPTDPSPPPGAPSVNVSLYSASYSALHLLFPPRPDRCVPGAPAHAGVWQATGTAQASQLLRRPPRHEAMRVLGLHARVRRNLLHLKSLYPYVVCRWCMGHSRRICLTSLWYVMEVNHRRHWLTA